MPRSAFHRTVDAHGIRITGERTHLYLLHFLCTSERPVRPLDIRRLDDELQTVMWLAIGDWNL